MTVDRPCSVQIAATSWHALEKGTRTVNRKRPVSRIDPRSTSRVEFHLDSGTTLIDQIFGTIRRQIQDGTLPDRSRLPSVRQLAIQYHVSNETAHRAYDKLVAHGCIEPRRGSGFFVKANAPAIGDASTIRWAQQSDDSHDWRSLLECDLPYEKRLGGGSLPSDWLDRTIVSNALRSLARIPSRAIADYENVRGFFPLRQQLQLKLAEHGIHAKPEQIVTTAGAMEALHLILWSQVNTPRAQVLIEEPAPAMHIQRLLAAGLEIERVPRDSDGPNIEVMRDLCAKIRPRAFLCSSILQNPTSSSLSPHKAFQILKLADEFNFIIIDDDTYGDLLPLTDVNPVTRLATLDQLKRVYHIGSFSKTLGAGLRVGFIAASLEHIERITLYKAASMITGTTLGERVVYQILSQGKYRHHCESLRSRLFEIRESTMSQLTEIGCQFPTITSAGMYLWGALGDNIDASDVARAMADRGYMTAPSAYFSSDRSYMRFNIAAAFRNPGVAALGAVLKDAAKTRR
jgi:DNA-binding transcriptional MocR family regulator